MFVEGPGLFGTKPQGAELAMTFNGKDYVTSAGTDSRYDVIVIFCDSCPILGKVSIHIIHII